MFFFPLHLPQCETSYCISCLFELSCHLKVILGAPIDLLCFQVVLGGHLLLRVTNRLHLCKQDVEALLHLGAAPRRDFFQLVLHLPHPIPKKLGPNRRFIRLLLGRHGNPSSNLANQEGNYRKLSSTTRSPRPFSTNHPIGILQLNQRVSDLEPRTRESTKSDTTL